MARLVWTASLLLLLGNAPARAEQKPVWLERYDVAPGCPDHDAFQQGVERRLTRPLDLAFAELRLGVSITRAATPGSQSLVGKLDVTDAAGVASSRELYDLSSLRNWALWTRCCSRSKSSIAFEPRSAPGARWERSVRSTRTKRNFPAAPCGAKPPYCAFARSNAPGVLRTQRASHAKRSSFPAAIAIFPSSRVSPAAARTLRWIKTSNARH